MTKDRTGEVGVTNQGIGMKIIRYNNYYDIDVEFENGYVVNTNCTEFKRGSLNHIDYSKRVGEVRYNCFNSKMTVIDYINSDNVFVEFDNGYISKTTWGSFDKASGKSPLCKTKYGIGFLGKNNEVLKEEKLAYSHWYPMFDRVYGKNVLPAYKGVAICEEWHNFSNFNLWFNNNYYQSYDIKLALDKDILVKHNKVYSPKTCIFVPELINSLFIKAINARGDLPIGIYWHKRDEEYRAQCSMIDLETNKRKNIWLGAYDNPTDAFNAYKQFKESHIKQIAEHFKSQIPEKLYTALINYEVEITD